MLTSIASPQELLAAIWYTCSKIVEEEEGELTFAEKYALMFAGYSRLGRHRFGGVCRDLGRSGKQHVIQAMACADASMNTSAHQVYTQIGA